jgi:hypothetical protein
VQQQKLDTRTKPPSTKPDHLPLVYHLLLTCLASPTHNQEGSTQTSCDSCIDRHQPLLLVLLALLPNPG